jgi:hypothetical protein
MAAPRGIGVGLGDANQQNEITKVALEGKQVPFDRRPDAHSVQIVLSKDVISAYRPQPNDKKAACLHILIEARTSKKDMLNFSHANTHSLPITLTLIPK